MKKRTPTDDDIVDAYLSEGSIRKAGQALGISKDKVWRTIQRLNVPQPATETYAGRSSITLEGKGVESLEDMMHAAGIDPEEWIVVRQRRNSWQALGKDSEIMQLHQVTATLERKPDFFIQPVEPVAALPRQPRENPSDIRCALIIPDIQAGFRRVENNRRPGGYDWLPLHDRRAMSCVLQIAEKLNDRIDTCVYLGDNLDLAPWSTRWTSDPSLKFTTNAALRELYAGFMVPLREILPHSYQCYVAGNHEKRIEDALASKLTEAHSLRTADTVDGGSLLSIPNLLALDSIDVDYIEPYGAIYWLYDKIRIQHGSIARRHAGATAAEYLKTATSSMIWGHTHRLEMGQKRLQTPDGIETITAASPGCLCRSEIGVVPGVLGNPPDWQTGCALVYEHDGRHSIQLIPIVDGVAMVEGEVIVGRDLPEEWSERTGLPF